MRSMRGTIISTFGEAHEGIIKGMKCFNCQRLVLLLSKEPQTDKAKENLKEIEEAAKTMKIPIEKIIISPYDIMENILKLKKLINKSGDDVILNVTGGRKTLSLAASLAGFVSNPKIIVYFPEESNNYIEIPKFTLGNKLLRSEKREVLKCVGKNTTVEEILKKLNNKKEYRTVLKHLRDLERTDLIKRDGNYIQRYTITPSGELLR